MSIVPTISKSTSETISCRLNTTIEASKGETASRKNLLALLVETTTTAGRPSFNSGAAAWVNATAIDSGCNSPEPL